MDRTRLGCACQVLAVAMWIVCILAMWWRSERRRLLRVLCADEPGKSLAERLKAYFVNPHNPLAYEITDWLGNWLSVRARAPENPASRPRRAKRQKMAHIGPAARAESPASAVGCGF
eukprot:741198-Prorocentrum_minimum.AAC.2